MLRVLKTIVVYGLILVAGAGIGYLAVNLPTYLKPSFIEGDYSSHYQGLDAKVIVYGTKTCPYCNQTRELLARKNVAFVDLDVQADPEARKKFSSFGVTSVPVILVGNRRIDGFKPNVIEEAVAKVLKP